MAGERWCRGTRTLSHGGVETVAEHEQVCSGALLRLLPLLTYSFNTESVLELTLDAFEIRAEALKSNSCLQSLSLHACLVGDKGAKELASALLTNRCLKEVNLRQNYVGDEGAVALADGECFPSLSVSPLVTCPSRFLSFFPLSLLSLSLPPLNLFLSLSLYLFYTHKCAHKKNTHTHTQRHTSHSLIHPHTI